MGQGVDDGLLQRMIPVILDDAEFPEEETDVREALDNYTALVEKLCGLTLPITTMTVNGVETLGLCGGPLTFAPEAKQTLRDMAREHHQKMIAFKIISPKLSAYYGKQDGLFTRLCVLYHCIGHASVGKAFSLPQVISTDTVSQVARFMREFVRPTINAFCNGQLGLAAEHDKLQLLARAVLANGLTELKPQQVRDAAYGLKSMTAPEVQELCERLESFGWVQRGARLSSSPNNVWPVNPKVHSLYAQHAEQERQARAEAMEHLRETYDD